LFNRNWICYDGCEWIFGENSCPCVPYQLMVAHVPYQLMMPWEGILIQFYSTQGNKNDMGGTILFSLSEEVLFLFRRVPDGSIVYEYQTISFEREDIITSFLVYIWMVAFVHPLWWNEKLPWYKSIHAHEQQ